MTENPFINMMLKDLGDEAHLAEAGTSSGEFSSYMDTGSYLFNAMLSGSIYGGLSNNRVTELAGEEATGKSYLVLNIAKLFLEDNPDGIVVYFETEQAIDSEQLRQRGIDTKRFIIVEPVTVQEFRNYALKFLNKYADQKPKDRPKMMFVLDSLGQLSTTKEVEDSDSGKETRDMTRAQIIKATFRVISKKLGKLQIPLLVTNHVYDVVGSMFPTKESSGGCLVAGTSIITEQGTCNIEDTKEGEKVLTKEGEFKEVMQTHSFKNKDIMEIEFEDGHVIRCTPEHKFLVNGEWVEVKDLTLQMEVDTV